MSSHCELAVSSLLVCNSHCELTATTAWWAHRVISWITHSKLIVWVANSRRAHSKLTVWAHLVSLLWVSGLVASKWIAMIFNVSSELAVSSNFHWVSCAHKIFSVLTRSFWCLRDLSFGHKIFLVLMRSFWCATNLSCAHKILQC